MSKTGHTAVNPEGVEEGLRPDFCPWCQVVKGHDCDCALRGQDDRQLQCDCSLSFEKLDPPNMAAALRRIISMCPTSDPGPARDPVWGDFHSNGNQEDVARDCVNEALWEIAVIASSAMADDQTPEPTPGMNP